MAYDNLLEDVKRELLRSVEIARRAGIPAERIILDPGIGFGKTVEQNLGMLDRLDEICALGFPVLLGQLRANRSSATPSACRPANGWKAQPRRLRWALRAAPTWCGCMMSPSWCASPA